LVFDRFNKKIDHFEDINQKINIGKYSLPPKGMSVPLINTLFTAENNLFVNIFDSHT
jgi:hypothetical protein